MPSTGAEGPNRYSDETAESLGFTKRPPLYTFSTEDLLAMESDPDTSYQDRQGIRTILAMRANESNPRATRHPST